MHLSRRVEWSGKKRQENRAFTFTELVVVLAIIAVLGGLLLPALAATHDRSNRALCQYHLRQIGVVTTLYAGENNGKIIPARQNPGNASFVQIAINTGAASASAFKQIALFTNGISQSIWTCPNRPGLPRVTGGVGGSDMWQLGYQYFGGVTIWSLPPGVVPSRSPTNMATAKPHWTLAADMVMQYESQWQSGPSGSGYENLPPHRTADSNRPQGGNQVFCDGSVQWIDFEKMYGLTTWDFTKYCFFYQDTSDFPSGLTPAVLNSLRSYNLAP